MGWRVVVYEMVGLYMVVIEELLYTVDDVLVKAWLSRRAGCQVLHTS